MENGEYQLVKFNECKCKFYFIEMMTHLLKIP